MASSTIVNAICAEARSSTSCSVRTCASARSGSTASIARAPTAQRTDGGVAIARRSSSRRRPDRSGSLGMPGPPAIDIGMNTCGIGSVRRARSVGVFGTTPTIVSQGGSGRSAIGGVGRFDAAGRSDPGRERRVRQRLVDDDDRLAPLDILPRRGCGRGASACPSFRSSRRRRHGRTRTAGSVRVGHLALDAQAVCRSTRPASGRHVVADAAVTPGSADRRSRMRRAPATAACRVGYCASGSRC